MKRILITVLMTAVTASFVFSQSGVIREFTGDVELKHAGSSVFVRASVGANVAHNTIISTGFRSTAIISIGNSVISVRPLTRLTLAEIQNVENTESVNINLQAGRVRVEVNPPAGTRTNLTVQSPSVTASVRGTVFEMNTDRITVNEGRVFVTGTGGIAVIVDGGYSTHSNINGVPADPAEVAVSSLLPPLPIGAAEPSNNRSGNQISDEAGINSTPQW
ncbi:MAG: FecR family protein [Treponema sp.]|nr:FecR family protein [Treponema sp.]